MRNRYSVQNRLRRLVIATSALLVVISLSSLVMLIFSNKCYAQMLHNVSTASEFNQEFKNNIDQKMYYYVIESKYSEGLPIQEVQAAKELAKSLSLTTTQKDSRQAITSVLDLCNNLEQKIYQIEQTSNYDDRLTQLENNIYVLTSLVEEYMYDYLYCEAVALNTVQRQITRRIISVSIFIMCVICSAFFLLLHHGLHLSRSITGPLVALAKRAEEVSAGDLTMHEPIKSEIREIQTLSTGMEQMIGRLNEEMYAGQQRQESLRRKELALLQAQINPHFLYNTMDTIVWLIEAEKSQEAVEMVSNLSRFFRHSLSKGEDVITLAEEESHVRSYLQIQKARYQDILNYTLDIDPDLHNALLPKLTLQPLVENALYHGIKLKRVTGHISIRGWLENDSIILQVSDDGAGINEQRLEELRSGLKQEKPVGFGLSAVHHRLLLQFGANYGLSISSCEGVGTTVTARIPYWSKEGQE